MKQLKELQLATLKELYKENRGFQAKVDELIWDQNMQAQADDGDAILGNKSETYRMHDYYTSFYLTVEDHERFADSVEWQALDQEGEKLWKVAKELIDRWNNMTWEEQDADEDTYNMLEKANEELLHHIEDILHSYERIGEDQVEEELLLITKDDHFMAEWTTDGEKVYYTTRHTLE